MGTSIEGGVFYDESHWPLLTFEFVGRVSPAQWLSIFDHYDGIYARREKVVIVNDSSQIALSSLPDAATRRKVAALAKEHEPHSIRYVVHSAVIVANPVARGAMTALNWIAPPKYPMSIHGRREDAIGAAVAAGQLAGLRVDLPDTDFAAGSVPP